MTPEGIDYIKRMLAQGYSKEVIQQTLITNGWSENDVKTGFLSIDKPSEIPKDPNSPDALIANTEQPRSKTRIVIIGLFILVILGVLVFSGYYYLNRNLVLGRFIANLTQINSLSFDGSLNSKITNLGNNNLLTQNIEKGLSGKLNKVKIAGVDTDQDTTESQSNSGSISINFSGGFDYKDKTKPMIKSEFFVNYDVPEIGSGSGITFDYRQIAQTIYIKLDLLKNSPNIGMFDLTPLNDQWIRVNLPENTDLKVQQQVDPAKIKKLQKILAKNNPLTLTKKIPIIKYNGKLAYDYQFQVDKQKLKDLTQAMAQDFPEALSKSEADQFTKELDQFETMPSGELIIGLFDSTLYKFKIDWQVANKNNLNIDGSATLEVNLRNHNLAYPVDVPIGSKSWDELSVDLEKSMIEQSSIDTDNDGLSDRMETFYGTDPKNPDTDADGYNDGTEVQNGYDPNGPGLLNDQTDLDISTN